MDEITALPEDADDWRIQIQAKAAAAGLSVADYLMHVRNLDELPTMREFLDRLAKQPETHLSVSVADIVREARGEI